ncbi:MAG: hypothetical protein REJ23_12200 [Brevundimonas sp.]|nr:hypothetical protein [Brevundimonas sp.]
MQGYETPVLNQIAFAFGMSAMMFWPAWLAAFVVGVVAFLRHHRRSGILLVTAAAVPLLILCVFSLLVNLEVNVGSRGGLFAGLLDASFWPYLIGTGLCVLGVMAVVIRAVVSRINARRVAAHA